jgi:broad specificity phosphatase PhoE
MIRHGESTANAEKRHAGWAHVPLTEKGRADAVMAGKLLRDVEFDRIYVSDLLRAKETLALALPERTGIEEPLLREIHVGSLSGKLADECIAEYGEPYLIHKPNRNFVPFGGEDNDLHRERIRAFLSVLEKDPVPTVAAFCHEGSIQCMLEIVVGEPKNRKEIRLKNGSVSVFEYTDGVWKTLLWNQTVEE